MAEWLESWGLSLLCRRGTEDSGSVPGDRLEDRLFFDKTEEIRVPLSVGGDGNPGPRLVEHITTAVLGITPFHLV